MVISDDAAVYANFQQRAEMLGSFAAEGDQADAPGTAQRRVPHGSRIGCWRFTVQRAACRPTDGWATRAASGRSANWTTRFSNCAGRCGAPTCRRGKERSMTTVCCAIELMRLMLAQQLFTFVTAAPVAMPRGETQAGRRHEQRSRTNAAWRRTSSQDGPHEQDACRRSATNDYHERAGIAAATIANLHAVDRDRRSSALATSRAQLLREPGGPIETLAAGPFGSRYSPPRPGRLMPRCGHSLRDAEPT